MRALQSLTLLPPGDPQAEADDDEWDLPDIMDVAYSLGLLSERTHPEWAVADAAAGERVRLLAGDVTVAAVTLRAFSFSWAYREAPDAGSDPACLLRLEEVLDSDRWQQTHWRELRAGQVFYLWRYTCLRRSRGSRSIDPPYSGVSWEQLEAAWEDGQISLCY